MLLALPPRGTAAVGNPQFSSSSSASGRLPWVRYSKSGIEFPESHEKEQREGEMVDEDLVLVGQLTCGGLARFFRWMAKVGGSCGDFVSVSEFWW
jgi:hypothetical protein